MNLLKVAASGRVRKFTKKDALAVNVVAHRMMLQELQELEDRAMHLGMFITQRAINQAKNALGWEMAGDLMAAGRARRGQPIPKERAR